MVTLLLDPSFPAEPVTTRAPGDITLSSKGILSIAIELHDYKEQSVRDVRVRA